MGGWVLGELVVWWLVLRNWVRQSVSVTGVLRHGCGECVWTVERWWCPGTVVVRAAELGAAARFRDGAPRKGTAVAAKPLRRYKRKNAPEGAWKVGQASGW